MEKHQLTEQDSRHHSSRVHCSLMIIGIALFSLVVVSSLFTFLYFNQEKCDIKSNLVTQKAEPVIRNIPINLLSDGEVSTGVVEVDEKDNIDTIYEESGKFTLHDFNKGLFITNDLSGRCYVIPTTPSPAGGQAELRKVGEVGEGGEIKIKEKQVIVKKIEETAIKDTSFIPAHLRSYCPDGFYWTLGEIVDPTRITKRQINIEIKITISIPF